MPHPVSIAGVSLEERQIAQLGGVVVIEMRALDGDIPPKSERGQIYTDIAKRHHENLLIFTDRERTQSLWYWVKRDGSRRFPREHLFVKGQPGDLFLGKLAPMFVDISELDESGDLSVVEAARKLQQALDVQPVTKKFYEEYRDEHVSFTELIGGIDDERDRRWYASVLLNRLMFVYFLQRKGFVDRGNYDYLGEKLRAIQAQGSDLFYARFLKVLFFEGFAKPENDRLPDTNALLGDVRYLNGGLFLPHIVEQRWTDIVVPDRAFENLFSLFTCYSWNLDDTPGGNDDEINPDVLGYIFEKYINQKAFGAYYTPPEITEYLAAGTIHRLILERINLPGIPGVTRERHFESVPDLLMALDAQLCRELLNDVLPKLSILDPACGSGAFLVAAMKTLIDVYSAVTGRIRFLRDASLHRWLDDIERQHRSLNYYIKKRIITDNLFGVDIMEEATEIARLRLFLALVSSVNSVDQLEPLPNIDFNILAGNSLVGQLRVDPSSFDAQRQHNQIGMFRRSYADLVREKNQLVSDYRGTAQWHDDLRALRDNIERHRREANADLNQILLDQFRKLGVRFEEATWDVTKEKPGKAKKRDVRIADIEALQPFHWGYEFDEVMNQRGGFDAIITNPPWEILKPQAKEFFAEYSDVVTKNKMTIKEFEQKQSQLLKDAEIRDAWLDYLNRFPYQSAYFRTAPQYINQISVVNGKKQGTDINLYKLFTEQCFNLLRPDGRCGIITPGSIYTDLGAKQLRETLLFACRLDTLFGLSNEKFIFEGVHHAQKFCLTVFEKSGSTFEFAAAFRINPREAIGRSDLERFLNSETEHVRISADVIQRMSPDSLSIMEFKSEIDIQIAEKMLQFPLLGEHLDHTWNLKLSNEFHMTNDSHLFRTKPGPGRLPLYEGKMIHQFTNTWSTPRYWVDEKEGRRAVLGRREDVGQVLPYQQYRLGHRSIASSTNERTMIATVIPSRVFYGHSMNAEIGDASFPESLLIVSMLDSFVFDFSLRQRVSANLTMFYVYQVPVPRLEPSDSRFHFIVERAALLICTTPEFDGLAREVGLRGHEDGVTDPAERAKLRAELDAIIAHIYGLTEDELRHILSTFPLVEQSVKDAVMAEFIARAEPAEAQTLRALIQSGENTRLEFKRAARWNAQRHANDGNLSNAVTLAVAAFMNSPEGGQLLIGVADDGRIVGLAGDYGVVDQRRPGRDTYERFLRNLLSDNLGSSCTAYYEISFHQFDGVDICSINVRPASSPVYVGGELFIRDGNGKRKLNARDAYEYLKVRWPAQI